MKHARPDSLQQSLQLLDDHPCKVIAGGTDFYPSLGDQAVRSPVLDITAVDELRQLKIDSNGLTIGALTTWADIAKAQLPVAFRALQLAAVEVGSVQIQNRATVAGNLCNASPAADGVPPLLCCDAQVNLASVGGTRGIALAEFIQGNRKTGVANNELVTSISIPASGCSGQSDFVKLGARRYLVISIAMVATRLVIDDGTIQRAAIAVGSCSEVARRLPSLESALINVPADGASLDAVVPNQLPELSPIDDVRGSADYRRDAAVTLVKRSLRRCIDTVAAA